MTENHEVEVQEKAQSVEATSHKAAHESYTFMPRADIYENAEAVHIEADMPGVSEEDIEINLEKNILTICGHFPEDSFEGMRPGYQEYHSGNYERRLALGDEIDPDGITAQVNNGVLHITMQKRKESAARKITVRAG